MSIVNGARTYDFVFLIHSPLPNLKSIARSLRNNDNLSFSKQEDEVVLIIIKPHGISIVEQAAIPSSDSNLTTL